MPTSLNFAIVAALAREVAPLVKNWNECEKKYDGRTFRFFERENTVVVCGGIGAEAARRAAEAVIALYGPALIYSAGFAGAADPKFRIGAVLIPRRVVDAGDGSSFDTGTGEGVLVSFAAVASTEQKAKLSEAFGAQAVDMEAAAVAKAAAARGVPFAAMKAISDASDFELPEIQKFVGIDGQFRAGRFALFAIPRPWIWRRVLQLKRNSNLAAKALCERLRRLDAEGDALLQASPNSAAAVSTRTT